MNQPTAGEPAHYSEQRPRAATIRSRLMLEVASELVGSGSWPYKQVRIDLREQGDERWPASLFGSDGADSVTEVLAGRSQFAIINPATAALPVLRGVADAPPDALAAITTIPSYDHIGLAVSREVGVRSVSELAEARPRLRVSLRGGRPNHLIHRIVDDVLAAAGTSLADLRAWGGTVRYDDGLPHHATRTEALRTGAIDAIFDEGTYNWVDLAVGAGLRFLTIDGDAVTKLEAMGYRAGTLTRQRFPVLDADVRTLDFSGWLVFTRRDVPDDVVASFCEALAQAAGRIAWQGGPALPLDQMCTDTLDAPVPLPLHPAAHAVWKRHGFLPPHP
nr:hypothetical protein [Micromonospora sp. DSM 115978]